MESEDGLVVCFNNYSQGHVTVANHSYKVGDYSDGWAMDDFKQIVSCRSKRLYEYLYRNIEFGWSLYDELMTEEDAGQRFKGLQFEKTGRSFEISYD